MQNVFFMLAKTLQIQVNFKKQSEKMPKGYPNSDAMVVWSGGVWVRLVDNSHHFDPRRRLGDTCREQLGVPKVPKKSIKSWDLLTKINPWPRIIANIAECRILPHKDIESIICT